MKGVVWYDYSRAGKNMTQRKIIYSEIALTKRKAIKRDIKEKYVQEIAEKFFSQNFTMQKNYKFPLDPYGAS